MQFRSGVSYLSKQGPCPKGTFKLCLTKINLSLLEVDPHGHNTIKPHDSVCLLDWVWEGPSAWRHNHVTVPLVLVLACPLAPGTEISHPADPNRSSSWPPASPVFCENGTQLLATFSSRPVCTWRSLASLPWIFSLEEITPSVSSLDPFSQLLKGPEGLYIGPGLAKSM